MGSLIKIKDSSIKNRFLVKGAPYCSIQGNSASFASVSVGSVGVKGNTGTMGSMNYQDAYGCGNDTVSSLLNINFISDEFYGQQFYMFNNFGYWIGQRAKMLDYDSQSLKYSGNALTKKINSQFPATGAYMIVIGTTPYLKSIIAPDVTCPTGEGLVCAQLKYDDGSQIFSWSQDAICLKETDSFTLEISSDQDNRIPPSKDDPDLTPDTTDDDGIDWMKDPGPSKVYKTANSCPRKIRMIKK